MQVVTEGELVAKSAEFEAAVAGGDPGALAGLCEARASAAAGEDAETWGFMRVLFCEEDGRRCNPLAAHAAALDSAARLRMK